MTAFLCWGTWLGWASLISAALWQLASTVDVLRQRTFPIFPKQIAWCATLLILGVSLYLPLAAVVWFYACPTPADNLSGSGYLINRLAYRDESPLAGQWIWVREMRRDIPRSGQVLAVAGQEIEFSRKACRVDGKEIALPFTGPSTRYSDNWRFRIPQGHVLMELETHSTQAEAPSSLVIVSRSQIVGRAWARYYPLWERCLL